MSTNSQLLYALLAMDVYHRQTAGEGGIVLDEELPRSQAAQQLDDSLRLNIQLPANSADIGFSALAYSLGSGTIIAYRGTDDGGTKALNLLGTTVGLGTKDDTYGYPFDPPPLKWSDLRYGF